MESISIDVSHHVLHPETAILRIKGFIYANTLPQLDKTFQANLKDKKKKIIFDLTETAYISSGGWGFFISCHQLAKGQDATITLTGMKPEVHDAFELLEYDKVLSFFDTTESALKQGFGRASSNPAISPA